MAETTQGGSDQDVGYLHRPLHRKREVLSTEHLLPWVHVPGAVGTGGSLYGVAKGAPEPRSIATGATTQMSPRAERQSTPTSFGWGEGPGATLLRSLCYNFLGHGKHPVQILICNSPFQRTYFQIHEATRPGVGQPRFKARSNPTSASLPGPHILPSSIKPGLGGGSARCQQGLRLGRVIIIYCRCFLVRPDRCQAPYRRYWKWRGG